MADVVLAPSTRPPADYIAATRRTYDSLGYEPYRWASRPEPPPWTPIGKPLSACRIGLVASGGVYVAGQIAFHHRDDTSVRQIPADVDTSRLRATHFAYDLTDARRDPNCVFPLDTLRDLASDGVIGGLAEQTYTFMGGIYSVRKVEEITAPLLVSLVRRMPVDLVLLVPV